ncbi:MAG: hypothetical protein Q9224_007223, partial [Gallowayella concinna]
YISEFAILGFGDTADADAFEGGEEAEAAVGGKAFVGDEKEEEEEEEVELRDKVPGEDCGGLSAGEGPEEEEGEDEGDGDYRCEGVGSLVLGKGGGGAAGGVFD